MPNYTIVGAGPVGRETARLLAAEGNEVRLVSRAGSAVPHVGVHSVSLDARDGEGLARVADGADAVFMCAMAPYHKWPTEFPPLMSGVVSASEKSGAPLVVLGNVYGYGDAAPSPLTPSAPLAPTSEKGRVRKEMWEQALSSAVPALEVRASDYIGDGAASLFTLMTLPSLLRGEPAAVIGDPDALHAWSFTKDVAKTLVAASRYGGEWGRSFFVPSHHISVRDLVSKFVEYGHIAVAELKPLTDAELDHLAREDEIMREVVEMAYLYRQPSILDASDTERLLGVSASNLEIAVEDTVRNVDRSKNIGQV